MPSSALRVASSPQSIQNLEVPKIPIAGFLRDLGRVLPKLIELVESNEVRNHPVWGQIIPYSVSSYGAGVSKGHCIRPDILITADGPKICELDFVPSGRGFVLAALSESNQASVLECFEAWYHRMNVRRVFFATATTTVCRDDTELFARRMRERGFHIHAGNVDETQETDLRGTFIDRLFYRSEMNMPEERRLLRGSDVATAEPYLDSKAIFAMVHDTSKSMSEILDQYLAEDGVAFLRDAFPETFLLSSIQEKRFKHIAEERERWVLKSTNVEIDEHWGSRGVVVGRKYNHEKFLKVLSGSNVNGKNLGTAPILQKWHASRDWWQAWNAVVNGDILQTRLRHRGSEPDPITFAPAKKLVGARIGFYFLLSRNDGECTVTPYGDTMLRQDELVHGAKDAIGIAVEAY